MSGIFKKCFLLENLEILFMLILGIVDILFHYISFQISSFPLNISLVLMQVIGFYFQLLQMTDGSPFSMKERWMLVWNTELPAEYFGLVVQKFIKIILSVIVIVRCATTYAYVMSAMLAIFCISKKTVPKLMLPWLLVSGIKSICMTFIEALTGVYVCSAFGKIRKACIEFFISKALEIIFATYLWGSVLNIYQEMERKAGDEVNLQTKEQMLIHKMNFGRQRARSLLDESTLYKTACLNNFEFKDVPQIILQMLRRGNEMSEDSLLGSGMMLASVSNLGSFDNLKTSQSLGELGFMDLRTTQVIGLEEDENLPHRDKTLKFLKLSWSDVEKIKLNRSILENDIYTVDEEIWKRVIASGTRINKPKKARTEVFIHEIPQSDVCEENTAKTENQLKCDFKFGYSFSHLFNEKQTEYQSDQDEDDSLIFNQDEDEDREDEIPTQIFMSNIKEDDINGRYLNLGLKKTKGTRYAELYRQDFMSEIGPEVFDRAPNLPKVTSLMKTTHELELKTSVSLPAFQEVKQGSIRKASFSRESKEKICQTSSSDLYLSGSEYLNDEDIFTVTESSSGEKIKSNGTLESLNFTVSSLRLEFNKMGNESKEKLKKKEKKLETKEMYSGDEEDYEIISKSPVLSLQVNRRCISNTKEVKAKPCSKKRKIIIKRVGRRKTKTPFRELSPDNQCSSKNSDCHSEVCCSAKAESNEDGTRNHRPSEISSNSGTSGCRKSDYTNGKKVLKANENQIFFLLELLQKPLLEVLVTYYDLKKKVHMQKKANSPSQDQKAGFLDVNLTNNPLSECEYDMKNEKIWKSRVLETVKTPWNQNSLLTFTSFLNIIKKKSIMKRLLKYEYFYSKNKKKDFLRAEQDILTLWFDSKSRDCNSNSNIKSMSIDVSRISDDSINSKVEIDIGLNLNDSNVSNNLASQNSHCSASENSHEIIHIDFISYKFSNENTTKVQDSEPYKKITKNDAEFKEMKTKVNEIREVEVQEKFDLDTTKSEVLSRNLEKKSICSQESDEPISLYYSKAANLASPLLDMKRFIYPDHIHYSYKHVKKKGFDVNINGGFPLLVRENLTISQPTEMGNETTLEHSEFEIKRRPMDLSFAKTNAFTEWQNNDQNDVNSIGSETRRTQVKSGNFSDKKKPKSSDFIKNKKVEKLKYSRKSNNENENLPSTKKLLNKPKPQSYERNLSDNYYSYSPKDYVLIEKLLRMHMQFNNFEHNQSDNIEKKQIPNHITSEQLHSNKGRKYPTYNPAIVLQKNKTKNEKKKRETQEKRTKDMFARLESEALLQNKNVQKSLGTNLKCSFGFSQNK